MPQMTGRFKDGKNKGRRWEIYEDSASPTGYTRKNWDPKDSSRTEYFEPHDYRADVEDENEKRAKKLAQSAHDNAFRAEQKAREERYMSRLDKQDEDAQRYNAHLLDRADQTQSRELGSLEKRQSRQLGSAERVASLDRKARMDEIRVRLAEDRRQFDLTHGLDREKFGETRRQFDLSHRTDEEELVLKALDSVHRLTLPRQAKEDLALAMVSGKMPTLGEANAATGGAITPGQWAAMIQGFRTASDLAPLGGQRSPLAT